MKPKIYKQDLYELWLEKKNVILLIGIIIIAIIIIISSIKVIPKIDYHTLEEEIITITKKYITENNINITSQKYIDLLNLENKGYIIPKEIENNCNRGSGILVKKSNNNFEYLPYLMCGNYQSTTITNITNSKSSDFKLLGDKLVFISQTEEYLDPGYEVTSNVDIDIRGEVKEEPGVYLVNYVAKNNNNITDILNRIVVVTSYSDYIEEKGLFIGLIGENGITINKGDPYVDPGVIAFDKKDGNITNKITTSNSVNSNISGSYNIKYEITNSSGNQLSLERIINVVNKGGNLNIKTSLSPATETNQDVYINVNIQGNNYYKTMLPNGLYNFSKSVSYRVITNGAYNFKIYHQDNTIETKTVAVSNIDKTSPYGSCSGTIENNKTTLTASSNDNVGGYIFKAGTTNSSKITNNTYIFNFESKYASVNIYDKVGNYKNVICHLTDKTTNEVPIPKNPTEYNEPYTPPTPTTPDNLTKNYFNTTRYGKYGFWLYVPKNIGNKKMPLVIFLHGSGECGSNLDALTSVGLPKTLKNGYQYDAIIVAPQNPKNVAWKHRVSVVKDLIDYISKNYNIDQDRISITGHSSGGIGAYNFAAQYPNLLSCIAPVSGYASTDINNIAPALVSTPILAYHGDRDRAVSYEEDKALIEAVNKAGGNAKLITLTGKGHAIGNDVYQRPDLINWMIAQKK